MKQHYEEEDQEESAHDGEGPQRVEEHEVKRECDEKHGVKREYDDEQQRLYEEGSGQTLPAFDRPFSASQNEAVFEQLLGSLSAEDLLETMSAEDLLDLDLDLQPAAVEVHRNFLSSEAQPVGVGSNGRSSTVLAPSMLWPLQAPHTEGSAHGRQQAASDLSDVRLGGPPRPPPPPPPAMALMQSNTKPHKRAGKAAAAAGRLQAGPRPRIPALKETKVMADAAAHPCTHGNCRYVGTKRRYLVDHVRSV